MCPLSRRIRKRFTWPWWRPLRLWTPVGGQPTGTRAIGTWTKDQGRIEVRETTLITQSRVARLAGPRPGVVRASWPGAGGGRTAPGGAVQPRDPLLPDQLGSGAADAGGRPPALGGSRTASTGCSTWPSGRTSAECAAGTPPTTSRSCAASRSTCSAKTQPHAVASRDAASSPHSTPPTPLTVLNGSF